MKTFDKKTMDLNHDYLELLSEKFPGIQKTVAEIVNLNAILHLPKGTEHFISDIHGEYEAFEHVLRNCSGSIRSKAEELFGEEMNDDQLNDFLSLVYYPAEKLSLLKKEYKLDHQWYVDNINRLLRLCRLAASKYSHSKIRKSFPENFAYIMQELIFQNAVKGNRDDYYAQIIGSIIQTGAAEDFIIDISKTICKLTIDHLHILGDIYDRGAGAHLVMNTLLDYHTIDIQWGNHDILWIGAAAGSAGCVLNAVRICLRYANTSILEQGYGINLLPLSLFASEIYKDDETLDKFMPKISDEIPDIDDKLLAMMQKAVAVIQFKIENEIIKRHPEYGMNGRMLIDKISSDKKSIVIDGVQYELNSSFFPTIDTEYPDKLTSEEHKVLKLLIESFTKSEALQRHINFMMSKGGMYKVFNNNLLMHACIPLNEDMSLKEVSVDGQMYKGKALLDKLDEKVRRSFYIRDDTDIFWFLWCAPDSPLFGKDKMATFERYFIDNKPLHKENYTPYYRNIENPQMALSLFEEFSIAEQGGHIICGHVPVKAVKGENPIKAQGLIILIDAGFSKAYQKQTGMAGCTLTFNSYGMTLVIHEPFESIQKAVKYGVDIKSEHRFVESVSKRMLIKDTDIGKKLKKQIYYLEMLLYAYKTGYIKNQGDS